MFEILRNLARRKLRSILTISGIVLGIILVARISSLPAGANATTSRVTTGSAATALQDQLVQVAKTVGPAVALVETPQGLGSGVIYDAQGDVVTNAHVVGTSSTFTVSLADGRQFPGSLVGTFPLDDLAVVRIHASGLHPALFGDSSKLQVGDITMAIGNPLGLQSSVTDGIISALGRTVEEPGGIALPGAIQTSAPINPGNSGGALADLSAEVIGIPTLTATDPQIGGAAVGIGFAIPSNTVKDIADQLIKFGHVVNSHRAYLGVDIGNIGGAGVLVVSETTGGPADQAGIVPGDIITAINGQPTPDDGALAAVLAGLNPGQTVSVDLVRSDGSKRSVKVVLGQFPATPLGD